MPRHQGLPVESSWRIVEGEGDSFDASLVPSLDEELDYSQSNGPTQMSQGSQGQLSIGSHSQDSIGDFISRADEEQVILRSPFPPSLPSAAARVSPRGSNVNRHHTPEPEFIMPRVDTGGTSPRRSSGRSSATVRPGGARMLVEEESEPMQALRRRATRGYQQHQLASNGSPSKRRTQGKGGRRVAGYYDDADGDDEQPKTFAERVADSLPSAIYEMLAWIFGVIGLAFRFAQRPLALLLALYLFFGGAIVVQNMVTKSLFVSLSPLCRIPGASLLHLPFCPDVVDMPGGSRNGNKQGSAGGDAAGGESRVEFDDLMGVQAQFEQVLERSADGVSLPLEMKRSESSIRDLRTMVRYSDLAARDELVYEFDGYIETARRTASDLQKFNTHVGSAVDSVISINRWTSRYIDALALASDPSSASSSPASGLLGEWTTWIFSPFQPTTALFDERALLDKYIEHTALVSDRIAALIVEAQAVLRLLTKAEDHLSLIYDVVTRSQQAVRSRRDEVFWTLWGLVGGNNKRLHNLSAQLTLLRQVDAQRSSAVAQVSALIIELEKIQAGLGDLRDRVAAPELVRDSPVAAAGNMPLSVHIETINRGVERLEDARKRIRAAENERIREALARGGVALEEKLIEG